MPGSGVHSIFNLTVPQFGNVSAGPAFLDTERHGHGPHLYFELKLLARITRPTAHLPPRRYNPVIVLDNHRALDPTVEPALPALHRPIRVECFSGGHYSTRTLPTLRPGLALIVGQNGSLPATMTRGSLAIYPIRTVVIAAVATLFAFGFDATVAALLTAYSPHA